MQIINPASKDGGFVYQFFEGGAELTVGTKIYFEVLYDCEIVQWTLLADLSGDVQLDIGVGDYASYPVVSSIVGGSPPAITGDDKNQDSTLSGWTTALTKGQILALEIVSIATITNLTLSVQARRT
jgi:hypothetical protein